MKRILSAVLLAAVACLGAQAQSAREEIYGDRHLAGSNYLDYDRYFGKNTLTPSPKGYEPFYLTHYGRHGSRWLLGDGDYTRVLHPLRKAKEQGKLTAEGERALAEMERFYPCTLKRWGDLTTVGERQHHGIGKRLAERFPEIFLKKGVTVDARSTVVPRCILSMMGECEELQGANPSIRIHNDVSESLQGYLNAPWRGRVRQEGGKGWDVRGQYKDRLSHPERLCQVLFNDQQWAQDSLNAKSFMRHLFEVATNMQSHEDGGDVLLNLFTDEECYDQWRIRNIDWYIGYGPSPLTSGVMPFSQRNLLMNIIESADTVTQTQAALRFGHEVCVMPLACLLELDSCGRQVENLDELDEQWVNYRIFPMACNVQLILYRPTKGRSGDILVKALLNEKEATLPVATDQFPYYRWEDVRAYYLEKIRRFDETNEQ